MNQGNVEKTYQANVATITACDNGYIVLLTSGGARCTIVAESEARLRGILDAIEWKAIENLPRRLREVGDQASAEERR